MNSDKIYEILNEARESSGASPDIEDYREQQISINSLDPNDREDSRGVTLDDRNIDDKSFLHSLYSIYTDEDRSLEDRGMAAALMQSSHILNIPGRDESELLIDIDENRLTDIAENHMESIELGDKIDVDIEIGYFSPGGDFESWSYFSYDDEPYREVQTSQEITPETLRDELTEIYSNIATIELYDNYDKGEIELYNEDEGRAELSIKEFNVVEKLVEIANDPSKDDNIREVALACAISAHSYETYDKFSIFSPEYETRAETTIDLDKVVNNLSAAKEMLSQGKVCEIEYTHSYANQEIGEYKESTRTVEVNAPTIGQKDILEHFESSNKIQEYFPGVDTSNITSSALAAKMENDPEVISYKESLSKDILWQQAEFVNDHVIVINRLDENTNNPIKDLPNGTHFDVCIEKINDYNGRIELSITYDKELRDDMIAAFSKLADERGNKNLEFDGGEIKNNSCEHQIFARPEEIDIIRDIVTDIAHEHTLERDEPTKDIDINR